MFSESITNHESRPKGKLQAVTEEIEKMLGSGKWYLALQAAEDYLKLYPDQIDLLWLHARSAETGNRLDLALKDYAKLRRLMPADLDLLYDQADLFLSLGYIDDCLRLIAHGQAQEPESIEWKALKSMAYSRQGRLDEAGAILEELRQQRPNDPFLLTEEAAVSYLQGDFTTALSLVQQAIEIEPGYAEAWCQLALIQLSLGDMEEAKSSLQKSLKINSQLISAWIGLGQIFLCQDEPEKAKSCFRQVISINPHDQEACQGMAAVYRFLGETAAELDWLERAAHSEQQE